MIINVNKHLSNNLVKCDPGAFIPLWTESTALISVLQIRVQIHTIPVFVGHVLPTPK